MDKDLSKALALASIFTLAFGFFAAGYAGGGDYSFHFEKAKNGCENLNDNCDIYAPLFHIIAGAFTFHENAFFFFVVFLLGFVTPMILYFITRNWMVVWLYYSTTSYFWFFIDGIFAQALAAIFFLLVIAVRDWRFQVPIVLLSIFSHGHGFFLASAAFIAIHMWNALGPEIVFMVEKKFPKFFLGCSGVFGSNAPPILDQGINGLVSTGTKFTVGNFLIIFTKIFSLPYFIMAVYYLLKNKTDWHLLILALVALVGGFYISHRIFYLMPLVLLPGLTWFAEKLRGKARTVFLVSTVLFFGFQFYSWLNFKTVCAV